MADLSIQGEVVVNSEKAESAFDRVGDKASQMANEVATSAGKAGQAVDKIGDGAGASAEKFTRAESRISASIKRATNELELLGKTASQRLEFNIADKGLDAAKFEPALKKLRELEAQAQQAQRAASGSLDKMGTSAAQTAAALRGVPAQFTDIITSLQGGQAPLTVFLQQGGQLKDMFGGAGNAARALGGYVVGLVNPFTIAAAAAGVLAIAYNQGSKEADAYRLAIVSTGNAAGTTGAQLKGYAQEISGVIGTQGKAAESLAAFVSTGRVSRDVLKEAAQSAVAWERATGTAVGTTAKQFADLAKDPLDAVLKLNEGTNFLTVSIYKQIKGLEEQGRTADAAAVAQRAYADALTGRSNEIVSNLGAIESGWIKIKDAAKSGWDAILNIGRSDTLSDRLSQARANLEQKLNTPLAVDNPAMQASREKGIAALRAEISLLSEQERMMKRGAEAEAQRVAQTRSFAQWEKEGDQFKRKSAKRDEEINKAEVEGRALIAAGLIKEADLRERIAGIREKYKESGAAGTGESEVATILARNEQAAKYLERLRAQIAGQGALTDVVKPTQNEELAAKLQKELETSIKGVARAQKEKALAAAQAGIQTDKDIAAAEKQKKALIDLQNIMDKQVDAVQKQADAIRDQAVGQEAVNANFGKSKTAIEQATLAQLKLQLAESDSSDRFATAYIAALDAKTKAQGRYVEALQKAEYLQANQKLDEAARAAKEETVSMQLQISLLGMSQVEREKIIAQRQVEVKLAKELADIEKLNLGEGPEAAAKREELRAKARANAVIEGNNAAAKVVVAEWDRTADQINQSLTDALMRGFESGKDFAKNMRDTVVNMFKTMVLRPVISAVLSPISGALTGAFGLAGAANAGTGAAGGGGLGGLLNAGSSIYSALTNGISSSISSAFSTFAGSGVGQSLGLSNSAAIMGNNPSAFVPAGGQLTGLGSSVGAGLGMLGSGLAGYGISSMLSGGYSAGKGVNAIAGIASAFFGPIAGVVGGLINRAFGRKLADSGIEGTLGGEAGFEGRGFDFYKGGWLRSDKTKYKDLDPTVSGGLSDAFKSIQAQVGTFATVLGLNADKVASFTTDIKVSFKGLDEAGIQKALQDALATGSNELAQQVLGTLTTTTREVTETLAGGMGDWGDGTMQTVTRTIEETTYAASEYAREGEKAIDTLTRLATSLSSVNTIWDQLGNTLLDASLAGADAASRIADAFGGLEAMAATTGTYFQNFYSADEQREAMRRQLEQQFGKLNLTLPDIDATNAREQYRLLAEAQDRSTDEGLKAYAMLLQLSGAFASITQSAEQARESSINAVFGTLQRAVKREQEWLQARIDVASEARAVLSSLFDLLHDSVQDLYGSVGSTAVQQGAQASAYIAQALATARGTGYLPDTDALSDAISAARGGIDATQYATQFEADRARLVLAGQLSELEGMAGEQLGTAERTLRELQGQSEQLDATLQYWRDQIELSQAGVDATLSVADAVAALQALMFPELGKPEDTKPGGAPTFSSGPSDGGGGGASGPAPSRTDQILGFVDSTYKDTSVLDDLRGFAITAQIKGWTQADIASAYGYSPEDIEKVFSGAGIPKFAVGTNYVPRDMLAQIHEGEAIIPKAYNPWANGQVMQGGDPDLLAELRALRAEVAQLRATSAATASNTAQMADQFDNVSGGGNAVRMEAVA